MDATSRNLLTDGDWACAHAEHETLAGVAQALLDVLDLDVLDGDAGMLAREVTREACRELSRATAAWSQLAALLREGSAASGHDFCFGSQTAKPF